MSPEPSLVLLAHGTGDAAGRRTIGRLLLRLRAELPGVEVRMAYAGVARPQVADMIDMLPGPIVVVPCFLAAGYHVRVDIPGQLAALDGAAEVVLADPLGPDPALVAVLVTRLREAGCTDADQVVLAAAGSTDPVAHDDLAAAATSLSSMLGVPVPVGHIAGGEPRVASVVDAVREPGRRVVLATWLLAPGAFHRGLVSAGADVVADPLGDHPGVTAVIRTRYRVAAGVETPA